MYHNLYRVTGPQMPPSSAQTTIPVAPSPSLSIEMPTKCHLYDLPNELVCHILTFLTTTELLPIAPVSHRIHALTTQLLHSRLVQATRLSEALILECYPPSQKLTAPALDCVYTCTPGIEACLNGESPAGKLEAMQKLYCRFKPQRREWRRFSRTIPGDVPGSRTHPTSVAAAQLRWQAEREQERVKQLLSLEGHELFVQLEGNLHLVRQMGFIQNLVPVHEGYVRIWRDWLGQRADADTIVEFGKSSLVDLDEAGPSGSGMDVESGSALLARKSSHEHESILWLDGPKNVGLRVNVKEKKWRRNMPVLIHADEEVSITYEITYEELFVRTSHIVFTLEKSAQQEDVNSGKAVVFGSWR